MPSPLTFGPVLCSELAAVEYKEMLAQLLQLPPGTPGVKQAVMELQKELLKACKRGERAQKEVLLLHGHGHPVT